MSEITNLINAITILAIKACFVIVFMALTAWFGKGLVLKIASVSDQGGLSEDNWKWVLKWIAKSFVPTVICVWIVIELLGSLF